MFDVAALLQYAPASCEGRAVSVVPQGTSITPEAITSKTIRKAIDRYETSFAKCLEAHEKALRQEVQYVLRLGANGLWSRQERRSHALN